MTEDERNRSGDWYHSPNSAASPEGRVNHVPADISPNTSSPAYPPPHHSAGRTPSFADPYWSARDSAPKKKRSGVIKAISVSLFVLVLIIATALAFTEDDGSLDIQFGSWDYHFGRDVPEVPDNDYGGDYREYLDEYYAGNDSITGKNAIPRTETGSGVTLDLTADAGEEILTFQEIYARCAPSVVAITADVDDESYYWGSGILLTEDGYIITNTHILEGTNAVTVTLWDNTRYEAKLVGADAVSDISVLKIEASGLTPAKFGDSNSLMVGDKVIAIGNPLGEELRGTMTDGIISAISRDIAYNGNTMTLLQTNAAINEGNSGGPLINMSGLVVGITNMKMMSASFYSTIEGIGFAIPTDTIKPVVDSLIASGQVKGRPAIGITVGPIPSSASDYYDLPEGLYISGVSQGSDAERQGIIVGDILTAVNGVPVTTTYDVSAIKDSLEVGSTLVLTIYRSGRSFDVMVELVETSDIY